MVRLDLTVLYPSAVSTLLDFATAIININIVIALCVGVVALVKGCDRDYRQHYDNGLVCRRDLL